MNAAVEVLEQGDIEVLGLLPYSSNYVFLTTVRLGSVEVNAVYKPRLGERPLWDFPHETLAAREVAAFLISDALGWDLVPPTVMRMDGELGPGSLQLFIDHDPGRHYFVLMHERGPEMARFAALDVVINNADRKGGHIVEAPDGRLWGVDHGLSFNIEPKLRTVIWAFADQTLGPDLVTDLAGLLASLGTETELTERLEGLLTPAEIAETRARLELLLKTARFPAPEGRFSMPWPLV